MLKILFSFLCCFSRFPCFDSEIIVKQTIIELIKNLYNIVEYSIYNILNKSKKQMCSK